jgi:hypothetical protein
MQATCQSSIKESKKGSASYMYILDVVEGVSLTWDSAFTWHTTSLLLFPDKGRES